MSPCFSKTVYKSNVCTDNGYRRSNIRIRLPKEFCETNLPCHNDTIVLVDEQRREHYVKYDVKEHRLLCGWREFACKNGLLEGDTLVFNLIDQCKFEVSIKSKHISMETDGARTGESHQVTGPGVDNPVLSSCVKEPLPANTKKRSPETYLVGPKGKILRNMSEMVKLQCGNILGELMNHSHGCMFNQPVDPVKLPIPNYFSVISEPMDLGTIREKLEGNKYSSMEGFAADVRLTFSNAMWCNPPDHEVYKWADHFDGYFNKKWKLLKAKLKHLGANSANDDGQDSWKSVRESSLDDKKELKIDIEAEAGKIDEVDEEIVSKEKTEQVCIWTRSKETEDADGDSSLNVCDSNDTSLDVENSECGLKFEDVNGFKDFKIRVNGETLDSEIPADMRMKYYQLCCGQKKFLHESITKVRSSKLVVAMILEIISIVDSVKTTSISTPIHHLEGRDKTLKSFQDLGMAVGSLRAKIGNLIKISREHQTIEESKKFEFAELESKMKAFGEKKAKIDELLDSIQADGVLIKYLEERVGTLKEKKENLCVTFNEVAGSTW